ncbi:DUF6968 family protein [Saccharothrix sp. NRRL B-16314]|uniref:DUF6968 family protein n=1 Tax=Saccharothrix sp. NRRL B-16314 TaxID=1463825 RepID=UPI00068BF91E|nr:hypothetical protein [Saccharothrix sp. NRRL B-16314]
MTAYELGDVVAERRLECVAGDGTRTEVVIRFGSPHPDPLSTNGDWCCPHQILGLGKDDVGASFGVDSLQALLLSVYRVRLELASRAAAASVDLDWLGLPELGLTVAPIPHTGPPPQPSGT